MPVCTPNQRTGPDQAAETPDRQLQRVRGQTTANKAEAEGVPGCTGDKGSRPPRRQRKPPGNIREGIPLVMVTNSSCYHNNNICLKPTSPNRETL